MAWRTTSSGLNIRSTGIRPKGGEPFGRQPAEGSSGEMDLHPPDVLILDEPTRGIDVGAKYEIYCIMKPALAQEWQERTVHFLRPVRRFWAYRTGSKAL